MKVGIISGSARKGNNTLRVAKAIQKELGDGEDGENEITELENKIANIKEPIKANTPVILETFKSKPYPRSHIRCLNSFNM